MKKEWNTPSAKEIRITHTEAGNYSGGEETAFLSTTSATKDKICRAYEGGRFFYMSGNALVSFCS